MKDRTMSTAATVDYVAKRAKLLAELVLTRQRDVQLVHFQAPADAEMEVDLIASLPSVAETRFGGPFRPSLGVQVMGTEQALDTEEAFAIGVLCHI